MEYKHDVFISHASEDKEAFVRPLAEALKNAGVRVWYDEHALRPGDNLRRSIDAGLRDSRFGLVVLSEAFFDKNWPNRELDGLTSLEMADGRPRLIPVWHGVDYAQVAAYSPPLANILAADSSAGVAEVARRIVPVLVQGDEPLNTEFEHVYRGEVIDIAELARSSADNVIRNAYFANCRFRGPAVLLLLEGVQLNQGTVDFRQLWEVRRHRPYIGGIGIAQCTFVNCDFSEVGLAAPPDALLPFYYLPSKTES